MFYIVQIELLKSVDGDSDRKQRILDNLEDNNTIRLRIFPKPRMHIQLANGVHIQIMDIMVLQKLNLLEPDCIALAT